MFYRKSIQNSDHFADPHSNLAAILIESDDNKEARKELQAALKINPEHYASLINLGVIELVAGKDEEALTLFGQAVQSNPVAPASDRKRFKIFEKRKNWEKGSFELDRILAIDLAYCSVLETRIGISEKLKGTEKNVRKKTEGLRKL